MNEPAPVDRAELRELAQDVHTRMLATPDGEKDEAVSIVAAAIPGLLDELDRTQAELAAAKRHLRESQAYSDGHLAAKERWQARAEIAEPAVARLTVELDQARTENAELRSTLDAALFQLDNVGWYDVGEVNTDQFDAALRTLRQGAQRFPLAGVEGGNPE